jgi:WD40 repeat protein
MIKKGGAASVGQLGYDTAQRMRVFEKMPLNQNFQLKGHVSPVLDVSFDDKSELLLSASDTIKMWDLKPGVSKRLLKTFHGHQEKVYSVHFAPTTGTTAFFASGSVDQTVKLWDYKWKRRCIHTFRGHTAHVKCVRISNDAQMIASCGDSTLRIWSISEQKAVSQHVPGPVRGRDSRGMLCCTFGAEPWEVYTGGCDGTLRSWDLRAREPNVHTFHAHRGFVVSIAAAPGGFLLASGSDDRTIGLWDRRRRMPVRSWAAHDNVVRSVDFAANSVQLLSGSTDKTMKIWDVNREGALASVAPGCRAGAARYSPDCYWIAHAGLDGVVRTYEVRAYIAGSAARRATGV